jgi:hypothetical protein
MDPLAVVYNQKFTIANINIYLILSIIHPNYEVI